MSIDAVSARAVLDALEDDAFSFSIIDVEEEMESCRIANNRATESTHSSGGSAAVLGALNNRLAYSGAIESDIDQWSVINRTLELAAGTPPTPWFKGFPKLERKILRGHMALPTPQELAAVAQEGIEIFKDSGFRLSGAIIGTKYNYKIKNSTTEHPNRNYCGWMGVQIQASLAATDKNNTLEAPISSLGTTLQNTRLSHAWEAALENIIAQQELPLRHIPPGKYRTVISGNCFSHIIEFLSWFGLNGGMHEKGLSFTSQVPYGNQIFNKGVTISDEPLSKYHKIRLPSDLFGNRTENMTFIQDGAILRHWYDFWMAQKKDQSPTGHGFVFGYGPSHLRLHTGQGPSSLHDAAKELGNGLLVTSMNYTRLSNQSDCSFTGMTRYGTFLIENGKIVARTPNLRFLESVPHLLGGVEWLSEKDELCPAPEAIGTSAVPVYRVPLYGQVEEFNVTGMSPR